METRSARPAKTMRKRIAKPTGRPTGAPRRHRGRLGLGVLLRSRLTLAGRGLQVHAHVSKFVARLESDVERLCNPMPVGCVGQLCHPVVGWQTSSLDKIQ